MKEKLARVSEDLYAYSVSYEANRAESVNKAQKDRLEETDDVIGLVLPVLLSPSPGEEDKD